MNELQQKTRSAVYDDEIDLREFFLVLWAGKWLIGGIAFAVAVVSVIVTLMLPNIYRAEASLAPNNPERVGGLSALAARYGGLASLAGINLSPGSSDKTSLGLEILKSRKFISKFIERRDILVPLMAAKKWDPTSGELVLDAAAYDATAKKWIREVRSPRKTIPSSQEAYDVFMEILSVGQDKQSGFVTVAIDHYSPVIAKRWVDWLIEDINAEVMHQDVVEAEHAINYLNEKIASTSLAELQNIFYSLIEEQTKTVMLAQVSAEYLFKTLDPAVVPEIKDRPKRTIICILAVILGGLLGVVIQFVRSNIASSGK